MFTLSINSNCLYKVCSTYITILLKPFRFYLIILILFDEFSLISSSLFWKTRHSKNSVSSYSKYLLSIALMWTWDFSWQLLTPYIYPLFFSQFILNIIDNSSVSVIPNSINSNFQLSWFNFFIYFSFRHITLLFIY